jgi:hypothetical protein
LRDIEILVQAQMEALEAAGNDDNTLREIQKILYSTEVRCVALCLLCAAFAFFLLRRHRILSSFVVSVIFFVEAMGWEAMGVGRWSRARSWDWIHTPLGGRYAPSSLIVSG